MQGEFVGIIAAPLTRYVFQDLRHAFNFGYVTDEPVDVLQLGGYLLITAAAEVLVDTICGTVEEDVSAIPLTQFWKARGVWKPIGVIVSALTCCWAFNTFLIGYLIAPYGGNCSPQFFGSWMAWDICGPSCDTEREMHSVYQFLCSAT